MIIDATNLILGRMATVVAKKALLGEDISILNCGKAVITGKKTSVLNNYITKSQRGGHAHGPFIPKHPERFVKRAIRGMLPHRTPRGRAALERIKCYVGVPKEFEGKKFETIKEANVSKVPNLDYGPVEKVCTALGAKI